MTATAHKLNDFEGRTVDRTTVKITAAGDGLSQALDIEPEEIELEERRFYVLEGECVRVSIETDTHGVTSRVHTIKTQGISKVEPDVARKMLQTAAEELERQKAAMDGQLMLADEAAAEQAEADDANLPPDEVAAKAAERSKRPSA